MRVSAGREVVWPIVAFLNGCALATVSSINASLGEHVGQIAATLSFFLPGALLLCVLWAIGRLRPPLASVLRAPWWALLFPGALNFGFTLLLVFIVPVLGVGTVVVLSFVMQMAAALLIDGMGWFGQRAVSLDWRPFIGLALVLVGVILVHD